MAVKSDLIVFDRLLPGYIKRSERLFRSLKERENSLSKDKPSPAFLLSSMLQKTLCSFPPVTPTVIFCYLHLCACGKGNLLPCTGTATDCITLSLLT